MRGRAKASTQSLGSHDFDDKQGRHLSVGRRGATVVRRLARQPDHIIDRIAVRLLDDGAVDGVNDARALAGIPVGDEAVVTAADEQVCVANVILQAAKRGGGGEFLLGFVRVVHIPDVRQVAHLLHPPVLELHNGKSHSELLAAVGVPRNIANLAHKRRARVGQEDRTLGCPRDTLMGIPSMGRERGPRDGSHGSRIPCA